MKYNLQTKDNEGNIISEKEYTSLLQISKDLKTTYCSCYNNFLFNELPDGKPAKKLSQVKFNRRYTIKSVE